MNTVTTPNTLVNNTISYDWHICMVSGQPNINILPTIDNSLRPKKVVLLETEKMHKDNKAEDLKNTLHNEGIKVEIVNFIESLNYKDMSQIIEDLIYKITIENNETVLLNITGGNKLMTLAMFVAAQNTDTPAIYLDIDTKKVVKIFEPNNSSELLGGKINLLKHLKLHGYEVKNTINKFSKNTDFINYCKWITTSLNNVKEDISSLNKWTDDLNKQNKLKGSFDEKNIIIDYCLDNGLLSRTTNGQLEFKNFQTRDFIKSEWIEYLTGEVVNRLYETKKITDYAIGLEISDNKNVSNELDCVFISNNTLHIIECKTQGMTFNNGKAAQQAIYKLDSISKIGGITTKRMLISFHKLNDADIKRAHQKNITLVHGDKLRTLLQSLNSWIDNN